MAEQTDCYYIIYFIDKNIKFKLPKLLKNKICYGTIFMFYSYKLLTVFERK